MPRYGQAPATPEVVLPPVLPPSETVLKLRKDVRLAYISEFVHLFAPHVNLEFNIEDLEADLEGSRPNCCIPTLLGKLCNTLANDRNTNASNWILALRRAYNRRFPQEENPFYRYVRVPIPLEEDNKPTSAQEQEQGEKQVDGDVKAVCTPEIKLDDAVDAKMELDSPANASTSLNPEATPTAEPLPTAATDDSAPTADAPAPTAAPRPAETTNGALSEEKGDKAVLGEEKPAEGAAQVDEMDLDYYEDRIDVEWSEVDLETKIQAIYNICHWHMDDAERFRRYLKFEDDDGWRIDPIGSDVKKNQYYFFDDNRLWIHRAAPPPPRSHQASTSVSTSKSKSKSKASKGKGKASTSTTAATSDNKKKRLRSLSPELAEPKVEPRPAPVPESPNKRARVSRNRNEEWEEIPLELQAEWAKESEVKKEDEEPRAEEADSARQEREDSSSSALTSLLDEEEEEEPEEEKPEPFSRPANTKCAEDAQSDYNTEEEDEDADSVEERSEWGVDENGLMKWERDFWAERERIEALEDFVEWEAICVTRKEWETFADKFNTSKNRNERALRDLIKTEILPQVISTILEKEKAQIQEIIAMNRKRSTRIATMESEEDEKARIAAEKAAESSKLSRASRHKIIANLNGGDDSNSETGSSKGAAAAQETREDRLRKREEEKKAREAAVEAAQLEEVRRLEREAAIEANGGVVPPGMETPEELETMRLEKEKEERRAAREEAKEVKEAEKRAKTKAAKEARASGKAVEVHEVDEEPPWYLDCEICKDAGWNMDDGRDLLSCDKCEEWQHLQCHVQAHAVPGRPPVDFSAEDFSFVCARCRVNPNRPRRIPPPNLPPPQAYVPSAPPPPAKKGRPKKAPPPPPTPAPPRPSPAERKQQRQNPPAPVRTAAKNGASSASPPAAAAAAAAPSIPGPGQPPLSYDALKALIQSQPVLINQLPAQYQQHFGQLLRIPVPYPTSASPAAPALASPPAPTPTATASTSAQHSAPQAQAPPPADSVAPGASVAAPSLPPNPNTASQGVAPSNRPPAAVPSALGNGSA